MIMVQDIKAPSQVVLSRIMDFEKYDEMVSNVDSCVNYASYHEGRTQTIKSAYESAFILSCFSRSSQGLLYIVAQTRLPRRFQLVPCTSSSSTSCGIPTILSSAALYLAWIMTEDPTWTIQSVTGMCNLVHETTVVSSTHVNANFAAGFLVQSSTCSKRRR